MRESKNGGEKEERGWEVRGRRWVGKGDGMLERGVGMYVRGRRWVEKGGEREVMDWEGRGRRWVGKKGEREEMSWEGRWEGGEMWWEWR